MPRSKTRDAGPCCARPRAQQRRDALDPGKMTIPAVGPPARKSPRTATEGYGRLWTVRFLAGPAFIRTPKLGAKEIDLGPATATM
jgi:hypothetical protein